MAHSASISYNFHLSLIIQEGCSCLGQIPPFPKQEVGMGTKIIEPCGKEGPGNLVMRVSWIGRGGSKRGIELKAKKDEQSC